MMKKFGRTGRCLSFWLEHYGDVHILGKPILLARDIRNQSHLPERSWRDWELSRSLSFKVKCKARMEIFTKT
jgi:hypothetical protein